MSSACLHPAARFGRNSAALSSYLPQLLATYHYETDIHLLGRCTCRVRCSTPVSSPSTFLPCNISLRVLVFPDANLHGLVSPPQGRLPVPSIGNIQVFTFSRNCVRVEFSSYFANAPSCPLPHLIFHFSSSTPIRYFLQESGNSSYLYRSSSSMFLHVVLHSEFPLRFSILIALRLNGATPVFSPNNVT